MNSRSPTLEARSILCIPGLVNVYSLRNGKIHPFFMGKSTISMAMASIANCWHHQAGYSSVPAHHRELPNYPRPSVGAPYITGVFPGSNLWRHVVSTIFWAKLGVYPLKTRPEKLGLILQFRFLKWQPFGGVPCRIPWGTPLVVWFCTHKSVG